MVQTWQVSWLGLTQPETQSNAAWNGRQPNNAKSSTPSSWIVSNFHAFPSWTIGGIGWIPTPANIYFEENTWEIWEKYFCNIGGCWTRIHGIVRRPFLPHRSAQKPLKSSHPSIPSFIHSQSLHPDTAPLCIAFSSATIMTSASSSTSSSDPEPEIIGAKIPSAPLSSISHKPAICLGELSRCLISFIISWLERPEPSAILAKSDTTIVNWRLCLVGLPPPMHSLFLLVMSKLPFSSAVMSLSSPQIKIRAGWSICGWITSLVLLLIDMFMCRCLTYVREAVQRASTKSQLQKSHLDTLLSERVRLEFKEREIERNWEGNGCVYNPWPGSGLGHRQRPARRASRDFNHRCQRIPGPPAGHQA